MLLSGVKRKTIEKKGDAKEFSQRKNRHQQPYDGCQDDLGDKILGREEFPNARGK